MEERDPVGGRETVGADVRRQWLVAAVPALLLGAAVAAAGATAGSLLIAGALLLAPLLAAAWSRPDLCLAALALLIPLQVRLNLPGNWSLAIGFVAISALALVTAYREWLAPLGMPRSARVPGSAIDRSERGSEEACRGPGGALHGTRPTAPGSQHWTLPLVLFAGAAVASLWAAVELGEAVRRGLYLGWFLTLCWLVPRCVGDPAALLRVGRAIVLATALVALLGTLQFALQFFVGVLPLVGFWIQFVTPILEGERVAEFYRDFGTNWILWIGGQPLMRAIGPFSGPPDVAQYLGISLPLAVALTLQRPRLRARDLAGLSLLLLFLVLTFSRQAWVGVFSALIVICLVGSRFSVLGSRLKGNGKDGPAVAFAFNPEPRTQNPEPNAVLARRLAFPLAAVVVILGAALIAGNLQPEGPLAGVAERVRSIGDRGDESNVARFDTWVHALALAEENPIVGVGLGNYATAAQDRHGAYSHNTYLDVLVETGPVGLLGLLLLLLRAAIGAWQVAGQTKRPELQAFGLGALGSVVAVAVIFFFDDAFYFPRAGQAFWLLLGLIAAAGRLVR